MYVRMCVIPCLTDRRTNIHNVDSRTPNMSGLCKESITLIYAPPPLQPANHLHPTSHTAPQPTFLPSHSQLLVTETFLQLALSQPCPSASPSLSNRVLPSAALKKMTVKETGVAPALAAAASTAAAAVAAEKTGVGRGGFGGRAALLHSPSACACTPYGCAGAQTACPAAPQRQRTVQHRGGWGCP